MLPIEKLFFLIIILQIQTSYIFSKFLMVNTAVANLRYQPQAHDHAVKLPTSDITNPFQITQILLGEHLIAHEIYIDKKNQTWYHVNTMQQEFFQEFYGWHGYPGWIQAEDVIFIENFSPHNIVVNKKTASLFNEKNERTMTISLGTRLHAIEKIDNKYKILLPNKTIAYIFSDDIYQITPIVQESEEQLRNQIIQTALQFLGDWYSWGGRSAQNDDFNPSSVDCSALVHLSFLAHGLQIPRMSHEQFLKSEKITNCADLKPSDLIYFISITKHSARMDHVMMYLGNDQILESTFADDHKIRIISFQERMGKSCSTIQNGDVIVWNDEEFYVYFGSLLYHSEFIQILRDNALNFIY